MKLSRTGRITITRDALKALAVEALAKTAYDYSVAALDSAAVVASSDGEGEVQSVVIMWSEEMEL